MGDGNASADRAQPVTLGPVWGGTGLAPSSLAVVFSSRAGIEQGLGKRIDTRRRVVAVEGTRSIAKADLPYNAACPPIEVDPATGDVTLAGDRLAAEPVASVPLSRLYWLS